MADTPRIVIVGAGITGLSAAYHLQRTAPDVEAVLLESENRLGGKILTERIGGFVIEAGPDSFLASKPAGIELCRELGLENRLEGTKPDNRRTFVLRAGSLHDLPEGLSGLVPTHLRPVMTSSLLSTTGKLRFLLDMLLPPRRRTEDESLASFMQRHFGHEIYQRLIEPLMAGIYAGDGSQLSAAATFPQLRNVEQEHGSLLRGLRVTQPSGGGPRPAGRSGFLAPIGGMAEIVETLARQLSGVRILTGARAKTVRREQQGYTIVLDGGDLMSAGAVILTTSASAAASLVAELDKELAHALDSIPCASTATVSLGYPLDGLPRFPHGYGYVVPRAEGRPVLACTWTSSKFAHRAPQSHALLRVFIGRAGQQDILAGSDQDLFSLARRELLDVLAITAEPILQRVYRWPNGMPQYNLGHLERLATVEERLQELEGLFVAGNAYRGVGIPDCILAGQRASADALRFMRDSGASQTIRGDAQPSWREKAGHTRPA